MNRQSGFTLLELLLASALTAMMMVAVMGLVTQVVRPIDAVDVDGEAGGVVSEAWLSLLRDELGQAHTITPGNNRIDLMSFGGLDARSYERTQRPVLVRYQVAEVDGRSWLIRSEKSLDASQQRPARRELVGAGVNRVELVPAVSSNPAEASAAGRSGRDVGEVELHEQYLSEGVWLLRLWTDDPVKPAVERAVVLRERLAG